MYLPLLLRRTVFVKYVTDKQNYFISSQLLGFRVANIRFIQHGNEPFVINASIDILYKYTIFSNIIFFEIREVQKRNPH